MACKHIEHVINRNAAGSTYIRTLKDTDTVLNYRKGYYAVRYKEPHFIERKLVESNGKPVLDSAGREQWKAVATAAKATVKDSVSFFIRSAATIEALVLYLNRTRL